MRSLDQLRQRLADLDRQIFTLIAQRQELAIEIGKEKLATHVATRDFAQEKIVVERATQQATAMGLRPDVAREIALLLIESSLTAQEQHRVAQASVAGERALVIGGGGRMGGWMARFLESQGYVVEIADPHDPATGHRHFADWRETSLDHDLIVVAAPLRASQIILDQMGSSPPPGLIFDIGSLKTPLRDSLDKLARAGAMVTSVHPMFGPDTALLSGRHVIFVDVGVPAATERARRLFDATTAIQVEMDLDSHDRAIAYVLGLSHALNITFSTALERSGAAAPDLMELSSTTFDAQLAVATRVASENPHLYFEIQNLNEYGLEPLEALVVAAQRLQEVVRTGDEAGFAQLMERGKRYLGTRTRA